MASTINASSTGVGGIISTGDSSGELQLQTGGVAAVTINSSQAVSLANALPVASGGTGLTSPGTSGNVLTSNGTAWTSAAPSGGFSNVQVFTSNGTFTVPSGVTKVKVTVVGGGGNGGAVTGPGTGQGGAGGGGAIKIVSGLTPAGTVSVTVGGVAGTSSFGAYCSATGGASGNGETAALNTSVGTGSGGDINMSGGIGGFGQTSLSTANFVAYGGNGAFGFGIGAQANIGDAAGIAGIGYGAGGSGAKSSASNYSGGAGTSGIVIVEY